MCFSPSFPSHFLTANDLGPFHHPLPLQGRGENMGGLLVVRSFVSLRMTSEKTTSLFFHLCLLGAEDLLVGHAGEFGELADGAAMELAVGDDAGLLVKGTEEELADVGEGMVGLKI